MAIFVGAIFSIFVQAQNIVETEGGIVRERRALAGGELDLLKVPPAAAEMEAPVPSNDVRERLAKHIDELIAGWPWRPFYHQLGISGAETHFGHPDELFHVLSMALPALDVAHATKVKAFLSDRLRESPPYQLAGFPPHQGRARERYTVPETLRSARRSEARDLWGVHAFLEYVVASELEGAVPAHWPAIRERIAPLLEKDYPFDPTSGKYRNDEAQRLNGDLAGLYAAIHLGRMAQDERTAALAEQKAASLLQMRLDLERLNPRFLEPTTVATKSLHHSKLSRYLHLPEPAMVMLRHDGTAAERLRPFREARPGWWMAFGDRYIGGENYTTSPDFGRALFIAAMELEPASPQQASAWLDVPWCKADLYYIERVTLFLRATAKK